MAAGVLPSQKEEARVPPTTTDLTCTETFEMPCSPVHEQQQQETPSSNRHVPPVKAFMDMTLVRDDRVLRNLLKWERRSLPSAPDYFRFVQRDIAPPMRKIVADWMLQVCQELQCQPEVFALAMNYLDRFLARCRVRKGSLQLAGSVCLLLASKFKETCPILGERLIFYSDFSIRSEEIKDWELLILQELRWELSAVTPLDFLDQILERLALDERVIDVDDVRRRAETVLALAATEYKFCYLNPSLLAASALYAVLSNLLAALLSRADVVPAPCLGKLCQDLRGLMDNLKTLSNAPADEIQLCAKQLILSSPSYLTTFEAIATSGFMEEKEEKAVVSRSPSQTTLTSTSSSVTLTASPSPSSVVEGDFQMMSPEHKSDQLNQSAGGGFSILVS